MARWETPVEVGAKHIRWGLGLFIFGLVVGYIPLAHYMHGSFEPVGEAFLKNVTLWWGCAFTVLRAWHPPFVRAELLRNLWPVLLAITPSLCVAELLLHSDPCWNMGLAPSHQRTSNGWGFSR